MTREKLDGDVSGVAAMGFEWIQKPLGWRERYWKLLELRMRAAWRSMTWTIGFLMGTRNLADWWQVLIGLERTSQQQKRPHCRQKAVILLDVGCRCVLPWQGAVDF